MAQQNERSFRKLLPGFVIAAGTQVVLKVAKTLSDGQQFKPAGSVGVVLESPPDSRQPYVVRFTDGTVVQALFDELAVSHPEGHSLELIHRHSGNAAQTRRLGPYAIESLINLPEEGRATVYRVSIAPNQRTRISYHRVAEEYYFVLAGQGAAILGGQEYRLQAGDFLRLPPGTTHGFITEDVPLEMLNVHTPGCRPDHDTYFADGEPPEGFAHNG
jgi:mannose-6-phosphate isomerase-like protein (cupin superfamily)